MKHSLDKKYRPRKLSDVVGQDAAKKIIYNSFKRDDLHPAYIFEGIFGSGKTSMARILAAMENCENGPTDEPCCKCKNCKAIFSGKSSDIKEIDAAKNRGIDDVREIEKQIRYSPINARTKYIIVDEAHGWTGYAADAALKMIEEPPSNVRFILCTTNVEKITDTIRSRCVSLSFHKVHWQEISNLLKKIADNEEMEYEDSALNVVAKASKGSVRAAVNNLAKLRQYSDKLTDESARELFQSIDVELLGEIVVSILDKDAASSTLKLNEVMKKNNNADDLFKGFFDLLRKILLFKTCKDKMLELGFDDNEYKYIKHNFDNDKLKVRIVSLMIQNLAEAKRELLVNLDVELVFEKWITNSIIAVAKEGK